jgi:uncharacterized membrane protein (DUF485 family)
VRAAVVKLSAHAIASEPIMTQDEQPAWEEVPPKPADLDDHPEISARNARNGLILFAIYFALYAGFMALSTFSPNTMALTFAGVNVAIWYGMGLIFAAFVLAMVYMYLARDRFRTLSRSLTIERGSETK